MCVSEAGGTIHHSAAHSFFHKTSLVTDFSTIRRRRFHNTSLSTQVFPQYITAHRFFHDISLHTGFSTMHHCTQAFPQYVPAHRYLTPHHCTQVFHNHVTAHKLFYITAHISQPHQSLHTSVSTSLYTGFSQPHHCTPVFHIIAHWFFTTTSLHTSFSTCHCTQAFPAHHCTQVSQPHHCTQVFHNHIIAHRFFHTAGL